ncbi:MAG: helix-turn-helix transcriptional regulator [Oscillospiraceae bacterium]|nr:helix-turn-helix transcriptional regulator [Oscillospiraceae bacterium]
MKENFFYENIHRASDSRPYIDLEMKNLNYFSHFHDEIELIYVVEGSVTLHTNSRSYGINTGEVAIIMPGEIHSYTSQGDNRCYIIKFFPQTEIEVGDYPSLRFVDHVITVRSPLHTAAVQLVDSIAQETRDKNCGFELAVNSLLAQVFLLFLRNTPFASVSSEENKRQSKQLVLLQKVDSYVNRNYAQHISLEDIAAHCGYSAYYFSHFFKEATGQNFSDYLMLFRVERSLALIIGSDRSLTDIAFDCGFTNIRSFNRAFRSCLKTTPSQYRRTGNAKENM